MLGSWDETLDGGVPASDGIAADRGVEAILAGR